jgi:membrane-associated phospholipid phosphatase
MGTAKQWEAEGAAISAMDDLGLVREPSAHEQSRLARVISLLLLPPLVAIATLTVICWTILPSRLEAVWVLLVSSFFTAVVPSLYIAYLVKRHRVRGGVDLILREERLRPYLVGASSCLAGVVVLVRLAAPSSVVALAACYFANSLIMAAITRRWKISAHAAGTALPATALVSIFGPPALPAFLLVPLVCWARVRQEMHSVAQVSAGAALGIVMTWVEWVVILPRL